MTEDAPPRPVLLVVHHNASPATQELLEAALAGARSDGLEGIDIKVEPALSASASDVLHADGFLLGTPANIGYMSGAMKVFFDAVYYPCLTAKPGAPYVLWLHGNNDTMGAARAVESITSALGWKRVAAPVSIIGPPSKADRAAVEELAATVAAYVAGLVDG
jgi:multimeric flavodoxin WrbA